MEEADPLLIRYRKALEDAYGERIERVVLYGSRARGEARRDSDYDVALFLHDLVDRWAEIDRLAQIETNILDDTGAFVHTLPFRAGSWRDTSPLMHEIRSEGRDL
jgi:predicted nucleotidyltransferase